MLEQRLRVVAALIGSLLIAGMQSVSGLFWVWLLVVSLWLAAALRLSHQLPVIDVPRSLRRWLRLNILTVMIWLTLSWQLTAAGQIAWHSEGMAQAGIISLRLNAIAIWCLVWLANLAPESLASTLRALGLPVRLVMLFYLSVRSLEALANSQTRLHRAMRARAHPITLRRRLQVTAQLLVLIMVEGLRRAEVSVAVLRARGLDLRTGGFLLARSSWRDIPRGETLAVMAILALLVILGWGVGG